MSNQKISSGYVLVNKPKGMSSFFALRKAQMQFRDILSVNELTREKSGKKNKVKMGHAGTLDPLAEGLLLCGVEQGTKILAEMILSKKSYTAEIFLGKFSETDDEEGEKFDYNHDADKNNPVGSDCMRPDLQKNIPDRETIQKLLDSKFSGKIIQTPPMYSALKIAGKRACDRVRNIKKNDHKNDRMQYDPTEEIQQKIQEKTREIEIIQIKILEYNFPKLKIFVECGSGTYIRSLARDIGQELQIGGYLTFLRRDSVGNFSLDDAVEIEDITLDDIQKFSPKMFQLPEISVSPEQRARLENGQRIRFFETEQERKKVLLVEKNTKNSGNTEIIGFGEQDEYILRPRKIFH